MEPRNPRHPLARPVIPIKGLGKINVPTPVPMPQLPALRPDLLEERPTVLCDRNDWVSTIVSELDAEANRLATKYGVKDVTVVLNDWITDNVGFAILQRLSEGERSFTITRTPDHTWGIFFREKASALTRTAGDRDVMRPVTESGIEVKRELLRRSNDLFAKYLEAVNATIGGIDQDVAIGEAVIKQLKSIA